MHQIWEEYSSPFRIKGGAKACVIEIPIQFSHLWPAVGHVDHYGPIVYESLFVKYDTINVSAVHILRQLYYTR